VYADDFVPALTEFAPIIESLAMAKPLVVARRDHRPAEKEKMLVQILKGADVVIPIAGMVDVAAERQRLQKEIADAQEAINRLETRLKDSAFLSQAPPMVIKKEQERLTTYRDKEARLVQELAQYG
jgi:valyl-tRNA synthetase